MKDFFFVFVCKVSTLNIGASKLEIIIQQTTYWQCFQGSKLIWEVCDIKTRLTYLLGTQYLPNLPYKSDIIFSGIIKKCLKIVFLKLLIAYAKVYFTWQYFDNFRSKKIRNIRNNNNISFQTKHFWRGSFLFFCVSLQS